MEKLFIIGNGFDLAHKMKTKYSDFHKWIKTIYPELNEDEKEYVPEPIYSKDGGITFDETELTGFIMNMFNNIHEFWHDFENNLGYLDFNCNDYLERPTDKEGDLNFFQAANMGEELSIPFIYACKQLEKLFREWISEVKISTKKNKIIEKELEKAKKNTLFISFNYTKTLEKLYNIYEENILYIHGTLPDKLIFGHGLSLEYIFNESESIIASQYIGTEDSISNCRHFLRKKTEKIIKENVLFFERIKKKEICEVFVCGFSFSEVDLPYIKEVIKNISPTIKWNVTYHSEKEKNEFSFLFENELKINLQNINFIKL